MEAIPTASGEKSLEEHPSQTVIGVIADHEGLPPEELTPPLYSVIDPEALDRLVKRTTADSGSLNHVSFRYRGYDVRVDGDGDVTVRHV